MIARMTVAIASADRPRVLHETVAGLMGQSVRADEILLCIASSGDCLPETAQLPTVRVIVGPRGLTLQRNCVLDAIGEAGGILVFLDDDVEPDTLYLQNALRFMESNPHIAAFSGFLIADGSAAGEIAREQAKKLIAEFSTPPADDVTERIGLYGCNMVMRAALAQAVRFDERLRFYALFEDVDFGERMKKHGRVVSFGACRLVHLAVRSGKISARRMGYAQIANPIYLLRKGSVPQSYLQRGLRNMILGNLAGLLIVRRGKSRIQRLGQLTGNLRAVLDLIRYGAHPERIAKIS
jgi:GT2 family glycosyltransferase